MPRLFSHLAAALLLLATSAAPAATVWLCGLSEDLTRIVCVADAADGEPGPPPAETGRVGGTRFPLDTRRQWTVNLWSPPTEPGPVTELARATLCWRTPDCEVLMHLPMLERGAAPRRPQR